MQETDDQWSQRVLRSFENAIKVVPIERRELLMKDVCEEVDRLRASRQSVDAKEVERSIEELMEKVVVSAGMDAPPPTGKVTLREWLTPGLLLLGGFIVIVGWVIGIVFLWSSPKWTKWDKVLATMIWPFGYFGVIVVYGLAGSVVAGQAPRDAVSVTMGAVAVALLAPVYVLVRLYRRLVQYPRIQLGAPW